MGSSQLLLEPGNFSRVIRLLFGSRQQLLQFGDLLLEHVNSFFRFFIHREFR